MPLTNILTSTCSFLAQFTLQYIDVQRARVWIEFYSSYYYSFPGRKVLLMVVFGFVYFSQKLHSYS